MASYNSMLFLSVLVAISALMAAPSTAIEIGLSPPSVSDVIIINGTVYCKINVNLSPDGTVLDNPPRFSNATVLLQCGNTVLANTTTNELGNFNITPNPVQNLVQNILNCKINVTTPLTSCNVTLPGNGNLISDLSLATIVRNGLFQIINMVPAGFGFSPFN